MIRCELSDQPSKGQEITPEKIVWFIHLHPFDTKDSIKRSGGREQNGGHLRTPSSRLTATEILGTYASPGVINPV